MNEFTASLDRATQQIQIDKIRQGFYPLEFQFDASRTIFETAKVSVQPGCDVADVRGAAHTAMLSRRGADEMQGRFVKVLWQLHGEAHLQQEMGDVLIPPGHWTLYDASRPYVMDMSENSAFVALVFEVGDSDKWLRLARSTNGRLMRTCGESQLALSAVRSVVQDQISLDARGRGLLKDCVWSFLSLQIEHGARDVLPAPSRASLTVVLSDAQRFVLQHLGAPDLGPDRIAKALRVSRRTVFSAFSAEGETPQAYIQRLRIERCRAALEDPCTQRTSITHLALDFGFKDTAYFSRVFRRRYGCSPSEVRAQAVRA